MGQTRVFDQMKRDILEVYPRLNLFQRIVLIFKKYKMSMREEQRIVSGNVYKQYFYTVNYKGKDYLLRFGE